MAGKKDSALLSPTDAQKEAMQRAVTSLALPEDGADWTIAARQLAGNSLVMEALENKMEFTHRVKMAPGDKLLGEYLGWMEEEFNNKETGEIIMRKIHSIRMAPGLVFQLAGDYELDKNLTPYMPGTPIMIVALGQRDTRAGRRVNTYLIGKRLGGAASATVDAR